MIECKKIRKEYQTGNEVTQVLKEVSFRIDDGEFVAIMGPSGSGKSTLMHIIGCLDTPTSGEYLLDGEDVSQLSDDDLALIRVNKIGFVFQAFNLLPRSTVLRNVTLPLVYAEVPLRDREALAKDALEKSAFPKEFWEFKTNQLSGGMMQRVAIARALVNEPSLILADEPTGNLDTKTGESVLAAFQQLHEQYGRTIILITHEQDVAEHAERIITVRDGNIVSDTKNHKRRHARNLSHTP